MSPCPPACFLFTTRLGGKTFWIQLERKNVTNMRCYRLFFFSFSFLLSCTEMGCEIDVAFFWTNILTRSSLSGGIALFPMFLGQSVSLNTASLQISHLAMKKEKKKKLCSPCQHEILFELLQLRQDFMYGRGIFNVVFHSDALLLSFVVESENCQM